LNLEVEAVSEPRVSRDDVAQEAEIPSISIRSSSAVVEGYVEGLTAAGVIVRLLGGTLRFGEAAEVEIGLPLGTVAAVGIVRAVDDEGRVVLELTRLDQNGRLLLAAWLLQ
jgi:hypothetical protein